MIGIEKPNIEALDLSADGTYGKFVVEPLERGYGVTLGNSLRRVLLSSIPGYAITSVKIDGVLHEFSTIPGVKEDVTEIVLNLKGVILKIHGDGPKTVYVDAKGEGVVTAGDIKTDSEVEILNPDHVIATLGDGAELAARAFDKAGLPYRLAPEDLRQQNAWGVAMAARDKAPGSSQDLLPVYLRLSQAERERQAKMNQENN